MDLDMIAWTWTIGHAAWTLTCSMDTDMQHGHGLQHGSRQTAWTRTCCMDMDMQYRHELAEWTRTSTIDMDM
jgi:hypothetical protein